MKNNLKLTTTLIGITSAFLMTTSCIKSTERPAVINKSVSENVMQISDIAEITSEKAKVVYVADGEKTSVTSLDSTLKQVKIEGKIEALLKKVKVEANRAALDAHLKNGAVALVILKDQVKILKVVPDVDLSMNYDVLSLKYMTRTKALAKTTDIQAQSAILRELQDLKFTSPKSLGEKCGLVEITSIKIEKVGVLENERTDYNEKKSVLNVSEKPLELSTHLILGNEIGATQTAEENSAAVN